MNKQVCLQSMVERLDRSSQLSRRNRPLLIRIYIIWPVFIQSVVKVFFTGHFFFFLLFIKFPWSGALSNPALLDITNSSLTVYIYIYNIAIRAFYSIPFSPVWITRKNVCGLQIVFLVQMVFFFFFIWVEILLYEYVGIDGNIYINFSIILVWEVYHYCHTAAVTGAFSWNSFLYSLASA